jgi:hypothetical protein
MIHHLCSPIKRHCKCWYFGTVVHQGQRGGWREEEGVALTFDPLILNHKWVNILSIYREDNLII